MKKSVIFLVLLAIGLMFSFSNAHAIDYSKMPYLGLHISGLNHLLENLGKEKINRPSGLVISYVIENSPAEKSGQIKRYDIITKIDNIVIRNEREMFFNYLMTKVPGDKVKLILNRKGSIITVDVVLEVVPSYKIISRHIAGRLYKLNDGYPKGFRVILNYEQKGLLAEARLRFSNSIGISISGIASEKRKEAFDCFIKDDDYIFEIINDANKYLDSLAPRDTVKFLRDLHHTTLVYDTVIGVVDPFLRHGNLRDCEK